MFLSLSILRSIFCGDNVASGFFTSFDYFCWVPFLGCRILVHHWLSMHKPCIARWWFFWLVVRWSLCKPIFHFAAIDSGRVDLVILFERICIGDCRAVDKGVFLYVMRHLYRSCPFSLALWNKFLTI